MNIHAILEKVLFGGPYHIGDGLPDPPVRKPGRPVQVQKSTSRLVNPVTNTFEWDLNRSHIKEGAAADLTDREHAEMVSRGQKNMAWNARLKLARVQGATAAEAAKAVGCSQSYATKVFAALSKFEAQ